MEHMNESSTLDFTQENQDSRFVAQIFAVTNVICPTTLNLKFKKTQMQLVKKSGKMLSLNSLTFMKRDDKQLVNKTL
jgi:hypothetical protein